MPDVASHLQPIDYFWEMKPIIYNDLIIYLHWSLFTLGNYLYYLSKFLINVTVMVNHDQAVSEEVPVTCFNFMFKFLCNQIKCFYIYQSHKFNIWNIVRMVNYRGGWRHYGQAHVIRCYGYEATRSYEEIMRDHDEKGSAYYYNNLENSNTHFPASAIPLLLPISVRLRNRNLARLRHQAESSERGMRSESSRHGLYILMVTESSGNISSHKSYSDSNMKKYYTPLIHNTLCDGVYCTEDPRFAMYHYCVGKLILPHHYYIHMFRLFKTYTLYAPECLTITDTSIHIQCSKPVLRPTTAPLKHYISKHIPYRLIAPRFNWT